MGAAGKRERKSARKAVSNAMNARRPRPRARKLPQEAEELIQRALADLRGMLPRAVEVAGELLEHRRPDVRLRAVREVLDRAALPRRSERDATILAELRPKLFELRAFEAPASWNESMQTDTASTLATDGEVEDGEARHES